MKVKYLSYLTGHDGDKIRSSAPSMMLYQKVIMGVLVGAVIQRLTCRFIGHALLENMNN